MQDTRLIGWADLFRSPSGGYRIAVRFSFDDIDEQPSRHRGFTLNAYTQDIDLGDRPSFNDVLIATLRRLRQIDGVDVVRLDEVNRGTLRCATFVLRQNVPVEEAPCTVCGAPEPGHDDGCPISGVTS